MPKPDCSELAKLIAKLALNIGSDAKIKDIDAITVEMQKHIPEITRKEVVDSINDATAGGPQNLTELQKKLATLKREAKTDASLRTKIDEYQAAVAAKRQPTKTSKPDRPTPNAIAKLREERDALRDKLRAADPAARAKVEARIAELDAHLKAGTAPPKSEKTTAPADLQALRDKRDGLMKQIRDAAPERREEVKAALKGQIQELNKHIADGTRPVKAAEKPVPADIAALRAERDKLRSQLDADSPEKVAEIQARVDELDGHLKAGTLPPHRASTAATVPDKVASLRTKRDELMAALRKSEPALRQRFEQQIVDMTARLESGDVTLPEPKADPVMSKELETLRYQRDRLRGTIRQQIDALKPKSFWGKVGGVVAEPLNLARSILTSLDFSAVLRQGGFVSIGNPVRAAKALPAMFQAFASAPRSHAINDAILNRPNAPLYARSKLFLAPEDGALAKQEEAFMSRLAGKIPGVAGSQRAYVTFLNKLRADSFDAMIETLSRNGEPTHAEAAAIANFINVATGRGAVGGEALSTIFFSPRYLSSRFQLLAGSPMHGGTIRTRALIAGEYGKYLAGLGVVYGLGKAAGADIELDPRSSDFGKMKFGNTRLDPLGGLAQATTFLSRIVSGKTKTQEGKIQKAPIGSTTASFLRNKLAPAIGAAMDTRDIATGNSPPPGHPKTIVGVAAGSVVPISMQDILGVMKENGLAEGAALDLLGLFGMGVQRQQEEAGRRR